MDKGVPVFIVLACLIYSILGASTLQVPVDSTGGFNIIVGQSQWFSSDDFAVNCNGTWYSTKDKSLQFIQQTSIQERDNIGDFNEIITSYGYSNETIFQVSVKSYANGNTVSFTQTFPLGCSDCSLRDENTPISQFPTMKHNRDISLGYLHYSGYMGGWDWQSARWPRFYKGGFEGGPIAWFDDMMNSTLVFSSMTNFPVGIHNTLDLSGEIFGAGIQGKIENIPAGYSYSTIMYCGNDGLNAAFMGWGDMLLKFYGKQRPLPDDTISTMVDYLGYSTTGYYFYNPLIGDANTGNYQKTLMAVHQYNQEMNLPIGYYLIDSFWYGEHIYNNAVSQWEDNPEFLAQRFPNGLKWLRDQLGVPFAAHMGKWSGESPYIQDPSFEFIVDDDSDLAIPQSIEFWDFIFTNATGWGLETLKQDHMNEQQTYMESTMTQIDVVRNWLLQQGEMCTQKGITIMYCMDYSNVFLNSLEVGRAATTSRASNDYVPDDAFHNWKIGVTSALLWSIGLFPYKDTFYSSTDEMVIKPDAKFYQYTEPYPITHAVVSVFSAGPVAPSDGINGANVTLIMRTCREDGLLLKPDRPAIAIDRIWIERAFRDDFTREERGAKGEVWTTYSQIGSYFWNYLLGVNLLIDTIVYPSDLLQESIQRDQNTNRMVAYSYNKNTLGSLPTSIEIFTNTSGLTVERGENYGDFTVWVICPEIVSGAPILLGELDKIIPVSRKRFENIQATSGSLSFVIKGKPGEEVNYSILTSIDSPILIPHSTTISSSGYNPITIYA